LVEVEPNVKTTEYVLSLFYFNKLENGLLVDSVKNHKDWYKYIKALIKNPEKIKEIGENLHKTVVEKYHIDVLTEKRKDLYLKLVQSKQLVEVV
jgi:glycosyltransferase involved in cell wall biosynthesis